MGLEVVPETTNTAALPEPKVALRLCFICIELVLIYVGHLALVRPTRADTRRRRRVSCRRAMVGEEREVEEGVDWCGSLGSNCTVAEVVCEVLIMKVLSVLNVVLKCCRWRSENFEQLFADLFVLKKSSLGLFVNVILYGFIRTR